jgi:predicted dithiol-disulfide oxidoreductase (DUF899 family)
VASQKIVSHQDWLDARKALLAQEKAFTRERDALSRARRELPWERVEKAYGFDGPEGEETLADLFAGRSQLIVYHFMLGPGWPEGCQSCSFLADHFNPAVVHLAHRDVTMIAVSRAPLAEIEAFRDRMGWSFTWVSSFENDFNRDYHVSFTEDELAEGEVTYNYAKTAFPVTEAPGLSVFSKDGNGDVFHTYSCYARGLDSLITTYNYLDLVPKGRDEDDLEFTMAWVRLHDSYED